MGGDDDVQWRAVPHLRIHLLLEDGLLLDLGLSEKSLGRRLEDSSSISSTPESCVLGVLPELQFRNDVLERGASDVTRDDCRYSAARNGRYRIAVQDHLQRSIKDQLSHRMTVRNQRRVPAPQSVPGRNFGPDSRAFQCDRDY